MNDILTDFEKLLAKFEGAQDQAEIKKWSSDIQKNMLLASLAKHEGLSFLTGPMEDEIKAINMALLENDSKKTSDYDRDRLIDKRNMYRTFINSLADAEKNVEKLHEKILRELAP